MNPGDSVGQRIEAIFEEGKRIGLSDLRAVSIFVATTVGVATVVDTQGWSGGADIMVSIVSLVVGYYMTTALLTSANLAPDGLLGGFGTYFGLGIIVSIGTVIGLLLLVIPGLILAVRWAPAYGYVLAAGESGTEALGASWRATGEHFWPIATALLVPIAMFAGAIGIYLFGYDDTEVIPLSVSIAANLALYGGTAIGTIIGLSVYSLLAVQSTSLSDVFE